MSKQITLELPDWANWLAQDEDGVIDYYEDEPIKSNQYPFFYKGEESQRGGRVLEPEETINKNWSDSKIDLRTHGAYIDADGILHRCELVPDMLRRQA